MSAAPGPGALHPYEHRPGRATTRRPPPDAPGRLVFRPEPDDDVVPYSDRAGFRRDTEQLIDFELPEQQVTAEQPEEPARLGGV
ncbi:hypothetical protein ACFCYL_31030, partial [Streptomyces sp. NPDC056305]|uniref:hypothetical protein n=1 Tax=Streptomyces sp. NPDC056305 TaxID=3345779 RepID=UPI0035DB1DC4